MMFHRKPAYGVHNADSLDPVASGAPYSVTEVNGHPRGDLSEFADDQVVFMVRFGNQQITVHGTARNTDDDTVVVYEKDSDGTGKDVRTWNVHTSDGGLVAEPRSMF